MSHEKNNSIMVSYAKTFNLGNYESEKISLSISFDIEESDNKDELFENVFTFLRNKVHKLHSDYIKK